VINLAEVSKHLSEKINLIPAKPGIYQMKDANGNIIYIGKSKTLKTRVKSYFNREHESEKIKRMVFHIKDIDFIITDTHLEAQILECELIKKIRPIYNAQFKNDQKYKYLKIEDHAKVTPIAITDEREGENCFGPYRSRNILLNSVKFFENIYPISKCGDSYAFIYNRLPQPMSTDTFEINKNCLIEILQEEECMLGFLAEIENEMQVAASYFQFETAAVYRDSLSYLKYLYHSSIKKTNHLKGRKILIGEKIEEGYKIFYILNGNILFKKKYKKLTKKAIEKFLKESKELEKNSIQIKNEKSDLDFKHIISTEIRDENTKSVLALDDNYDQGDKHNLDEFINKLKKINTPSK